MKAYIDVRGAWPVYIKGYVTIPLVGLTRAVTVEQVEILLKDQEEARKA